MWLGEKTGKMGDAARSHAKVGTVSVGGESAAVITCGEQRNLIVGSPQVMYWQPGAGQQALVMETDDGERFILGVVAAHAPSLGEGEICLRCGETWLKIGRHGEISAEGEMHIDGNVYITGRLFLNGIEVSANGGEN